MGSHASSSLTCRVSGPVRVRIPKFELEFEVEVQRLHMFASSRSSSGIAHVPQLEVEFEFELFSLCMRSSSKDGVRMFHIESEVESAVPRSRSRSSSISHFCVSVRSKD